MSIKDWERYSAERIAAHRGNLQAAWCDVLTTSHVLTALDPPARALRAFDRALEGFRAAASPHERGYDHAHSPAR